MAHHLYAPGDPAVDAARRHECANQMVGLLTGATLGVDGRGAAGPALVATQPGDARQVAGLLTGLGHAATDALLDLFGIDARAFDHAVHDLREELGGMERAEVARAPLALGDGGAQRFDDYGLGHADGLLGLSRPSPAGPTGGYLMDRQVTKPAPGHGKDCDGHGGWLLFPEGSIRGDNLTRFVSFGYSPATLWWETRKERARR